MSDIGLMKQIRCDVLNHVWHWINEANTMWCFNSCL